MSVGDDCPGVELDHIWQVVVLIEGRYALDLVDL